jgi:hypothetical protein
MKKSQLQKRPTTALLKGGGSSPLEYDSRGMPFGATVRVVALGRDARNGYTGGTIGQYGFAIFEDTYKGKPRLNLVGHGVPGGIMISGVMSNPDQKWLTDKAVVKRIKDYGKYTGNGLKKFANYRIVACNSGEAQRNGPSLAQGVADLLGKPVKGYIGPVKVNDNDLTFTNSEGFLQQRQIRPSDGNVYPVVIRRDFKVHKLGGRDGMTVQAMGGVDRKSRIFQPSQASEPYRPFRAFNPFKPPQASQLLQLTQPSQSFEGGMEWQ